MNLLKKNFSIIIQARFNSSRLKGKILKKIHNQELLLIMIKRLRIFKDKIIINISKKNSKKLVKFCQKNNIKYFVGSDLNVLKRYYDCASFFKSTTIVRVPSDCPLIDVNIIKKGLKIFFKKKYDYVSNLCPPSYIDGNDTEIFTYKILKKIYISTKEKFDKEHVTTFLRKRLNKYKYKNFGTNKDSSLKFRITIDHKEDFQLIRIIVTKLGVYASYKQIFYFLKKNKKIAQINKKYIGNMWYQKNF
jgi:spore coat polysaccharide biosynthesis protein SpsF